MDDILNWLLTSLTQYYGLDYAAVAFTALSLWRLGDQHRDGFLWGAIGNICFVIFNGMVDSAPGLVFNILFFALNVRALVVWHKRAGRAGPPPERSLTSDNAAKNPPRATRNKH